MPIDKCNQPPVPHFDHREFVLRVHLVVGSSRGVSIGRGSHVERHGQPVNSGHVRVRKAGGVPDQKNMSISYFSNFHG